MGCIRHYLHPLWLAVGGQSQGRVSGQTWAVSGIKLHPLWLAIGGQSQGRVSGQTWAVSGIKLHPLWLVVGGQSQGRVSRPTRPYRCHFAFSRPAWCFPLPFFPAIHQCIICVVCVCLVSVFDSVLQCVHLCHRFSGFDYYYFAGCYCIQYCYLIYTHTHITCKYTHTYTHMHTHAHSKHTHTHTYTFYIHTYTHNTNTHTHTYTHRCKRWMHWCKNKRKWLCSWMLLGDSRLACCLSRLKWMTANTSWIKVTTIKDTLKLKSTTIKDTLKLKSNPKP